MRLRGRPPAAVSAISAGGYCADPIRLIAVAGSLLRSNVLRLHRPRAGAAALLLGAAHARRLREQPRTHLHAHFEIPSDTAWVMHRLASFPFSFTIHTEEGIRPPGLVRDARAARFVATPSRYTQALLQARVGPAVEVAVVRAAVPVGEYAFRARSIPIRGPVRAVTVAGLEEYKGHSVLLRALADEPDLARVTLDIVGDGPLRLELEALTRSLALEGRVTFRGAMTEDGVRTALDEADLFVLPSTFDENNRADNIPVALMEAMSSGVPVVTSRLAGIPELVVDGSTGYLAEPGDAGDLARVIGRILEDPAVLTVTEHARRMVEDEFDIELNAARLAALIRNGPGTVP